MKQINYQPQGVCSRLMTIAVDDNDTVQDVKVIGGCNGNLQGIAALVHGMNREEAIRRLEGIRCGAKPTSCPDQLAQALKEI